MNNVDPATYLQRIPQFQGLDAKELSIERLGGLTNLVYRVRHGTDTYLLRIPGVGTEAYIDRSIEAHDAQVAAAAGVSAQVLFFDPDDGLMLAEYIDGTTLDAGGFKNPGSITRAATALRRMHQHPQPFKKRFDVFEQIDEYLDLVNQLKAPLPEGYQQVKAEADAVRRALLARSVDLAPCHCDPLAENFIDTGERVYIVDWEYAGNNDPMWDLGDVSVEAEFDSDQDQCLLAAYFDGDPPADQVARMMMYKMLCDLLWTLWGIVQHANKNPADDFWAYAVNRFTRCQRLMADPEFARHLRAI